MEFHDELDNFEEAYMGEWDSEEDFARHIVNECYDLELKIAECIFNQTNMRQRSMGHLADYFDYERYGRELFMYDSDGREQQRVPGTLTLDSLLPTRAFPQGKALVFEEKSTVC